MKKLGNLVAAIFSAAILAACGGNTGSSSAATSVEPQIGALQSGVARSPQRHASSGSNLYVANTYGNTVTVYAAGSIKVLRTISQGVSTPIVLAFDSSDNLYVANQQANTVTVYPSGGSSPQLTISKGVIEPLGLAFDREGDLYVADSATASQQYGRTVTVYAPGKRIIAADDYEGRVCPGPAGD